MCALKHLIRPNEVIGVHVCVRVYVLFVLIIRFSADGIMLKGQVREWFIKTLR